MCFQDEEKFKASGLIPAPIDEVLEKQRAIQLQVCVFHTSLCMHTFANLAVGLLRFTARPSLVLVAIGYWTGRRIRGPVFNSWLGSHFVFDTRRIHGFK